jgi:ketosteroid isomerase-like protein
MSQENVRLHRRLNAAFNDRDADDLVAVCDPSIEVYSVFAAIGGAVYHGHDGVRSWLRDIEEAWSEFRVESEMYFDLGEDTLAFVVLHGRGRQSGAEVVMAYAQVMRWHPGCCVYFKAYAHREDALSDLGVSEEALRADRAVMASANLDLVRSIFAAWERGDFSSAEWADPEIEFVIPDGPSPGSWRGLAGMTEGFRDFLSAWEELGGEAEEYRELDGERVLALFHRSGRGKTSGLDLGQLRSNAAALFHVRNGKVTRLVLYLDADRALADLGHAPEGGSP